MNNVAMNMGAQMFIQVPAFQSFVYISRSGISRSYGNSMFSVLRSCRSIFYYSCIILHSC